MKQKFDVMKAKMKDLQGAVDKTSGAYQKGYLKSREDSKARGSDDWNDGLVVGGLLAKNTSHEPLMVPRALETRKRLASKFLGPYNMIQQDPDCWAAVRLST